MSAAQREELTVNRGKASILDRKPLIYIWAPFYRFLLRIRAFFIAESQAHLEQISGQLTALERQLTALESYQRAQWIAFEQLYLCFLSDPDRNTRAQLQQFFEAERARYTQLPLTDDRNRPDETPRGAPHS